MNWKTAEHGIRYREHVTRRVSGRPDRYYVVRYRVDGRRHDEPVGWVSAGHTLEEARSVRDNARRAGKKGITLKTQRAAEKAARTRGNAAPTVADLWNRYAVEVVALNKPSTAAEKSRWWARRINPAIGDKKIAAVTEEDVSAIIRSPMRFVAGQVVSGRGEGGNLYRLLHHMFQKALAWKMRARELGNPLEEIDEPKVPRRERLLTAGEIAALQRALDRAEAQETETQQVAAIIRLCILTGARISELLTLRHADVRRDEMELHLIDTKIGFSRRPLSEAALAVIDGIERMPGVEWVFRAINNPAKSLPYDTVEKAFGRIAEAAGVHCSLHTLRHWFSTMTANSVNNPRVGMALTGHKSHAAYMNYVHGDKEQARALAERLAALATGLATAQSNVAALPASNRKIAGKAGKRAV